MTETPFRFQDEEEDSYFNELRNKALSEKEDPGPIIRFLENIFPFTKDFEAPYSETLNYAPADTQDLMEKFKSKENSGLGFQKTVKKEYVDFNGRGPGTLYLSDNKGVPTFNFYPKPPAEWMAKNATALARAEFVGNFFIHTAPVTTPFAMKTQPTNIVLQDSVLTKGKKVNVPITKGGKTLIQQSKANKQKLAEFEVTGFGKTNIAQNAVNDVYNKSPIDVRAIVNIAKKNKISYKQAEAYLEMLRTGVKPDISINPGSSMTKQIEGNLPLNVIHARLMKGAKDKGAGDLKMIDLGLPSFGESRKNESVEQYRNRLFNQAGFRRNENGDFVFDDRILKKNVKGDQRRTISQVAQTKPGQTVKRSFEKTRDATVLGFTEELGGYMKLTGSKPNLHHRFAAMVVAPIYRGLPLSDTPGSEWMELTGLFNERNIYPGSPVTDPESLGGPRSNLEQVVTKGYNQKVVLPDGTEKIIRRPPEPHDVLHHQYYKELGLQDVEEGKASWFDKRMYKITGSREGRMEVARELADIINEGDRIIDAAMDQIRALFGNKTDPDYIVKLLMELVRTGKLKITGTKYRLKSIEKIVEIIRKEVQANLPLADEQEVLNIVEQYNLDYAQEIEAIDLLHNIADYNESMRVFGRRPPSITHSQHKRNIKRYMELIQTKLPLELPVKEAKEQGLRTYTYKRVKPVPIENQLEIIFSDDR